MNYNFKELETENLILRKVNLNDIKPLWDFFYNDYNIYKFYSSVKINHNELKKKVKSQIKAYESNTYYRWAIVDKKSNNLIGNINLHHHNKEDNNIKIGYFIFEQYRNKGYATECVFKIINYAFNELKVHRISGMVISYNESSKKVLLKTGFIQEGIMKDNHRIDGIYYDKYIYGILNKENN